MNADGPDTPASERLNRLLAEAGEPALAPRIAQQFESYLDLLLRWNARTNLTAIRDPEGILRRHFVESIAAARILPAGITTLLDLGSGAGFPGIPIALCRPDIAVTLAESQVKKAAFLREATRVLELPVRVHAARADSIGASFGCVTLRAVDKMDEAMKVAARLVSATGCLASLTTNAELGRVQFAAGPTFRWRTPFPLPGGNQRILALGERSV